MCPLPVNTFQKVTIIIISITLSQFWQLLNIINGVVHTSYTLSYLSFFSQKYDFEIHHIVICLSNFFYCFIIFLRVNIMQLIYPFYNWRTFGLYPVDSYYKQCCRGHYCRSPLVEMKTRSYCVYVLEQNGSLVGICLALVYTTSVPKWCSRHRLLLALYCH